MSQERYEHRKAKARLQILNPDGTPANHKAVSVHQVSHQFLFGCGAFDAVELMKTQDAKEKAFLQERMGKWLSLFNYGTLPFYWGRYEPVEGQTAYRETMGRQSGSAKRACRSKAIRCAGTRPVPIG